MHRQRFSCEAMPLHVFRSRFWQWLEDLAVSRPFVVEEGDTEYLVVGPYAYGFLLATASAPELDMVLGRENNVATIHIRGMLVHSNVYQKHDAKDSFDIRPTDIEYRVVQP